MQSAGTAMERSWGRSYLGVAEMEGAGKKEPAEEEAGVGSAGGKPLPSLWNMLANHE